MNTNSSGVYGSSSAPKRLSNPDGTWNIFCRQCGRFIGRVGQRLGSAPMCAVCQRLEEGLPVTPEFMEAYGTMDPATGLRVDGVYVTEDNTPKVAKSRSSSFTEMLGNKFRALGNFASGIKIPSRKAAPVDGEEPLGSVKVATAKRRRRLFADVDIEEDLRKK